MILLGYLLIHTSYNKIFYTYVIPGYYYPKPDFSQNVMASQSTECCYQDTIDASQRYPQNQLSVRPPSLFPKCSPAKEKKFNPEAPSEIMSTSENNLVKNADYEDSMAIQARHSNTFSSNEGMNNKTEL